MVIGTTAQTLKVDSLSAFINDGQVGVVAKGQGATVKFDIFLNPSTGHDLNTFIQEKVDEAIIESIHVKTGLTKSVISGLFDHQMTLTFERMQFPVVSQQTIGNITIKTRSIAPDTSLGFPHNLF